MECLEYGGIPVCIKFKSVDYYKFIYGAHPFIIGNSWQECLEAINSYIEDTQLLKEKQLQVKNWYKGFIENLTDDIENLVLSNIIPNLKSVQFEY